MSEKIVLLICAILMSIGVFCAAPVQAEILLYLDGGATGHDSSDAAFLDSAKGNHALPTRESTGETGLGIVPNLDQTRDSAIGRYGMGWRGRSGDMALNVAADNPDFDRGYDAFSLSLWYKPNQAYHPSENANWLIGKMGGGGDRGWQLGSLSTPYGEPTLFQFTYFDGPDGSNGRVEADGPSIAQFPEFIHVAVTFESEESVAMYINGVQVDQEPALHTLNGQNAIPLQIGNRGTHNSDSADGVIDDLGIWDETLSSQKVAAMYAMGYFEGVGLTDEAIDNLLAAFGEEGSTVISCNVWQYDTGLGLEGGVGTIPVGTVGGSMEDCDAFVVLEENGNGMVLSSCGDIMAGDLNKDCRVDFKDFAIMADQWLDY